MSARTSSTCGRTRANGVSEMAKRAVHYVGESLTWKRKGGLFESIRAGRPPCCMGERAGAILESESHSSDVAKVTCQKCLRLYAQHQAHKARIGGDHEAG